VFSAGNETEETESSSDPESCGFTLDRVQEITGAMTSLRRAKSTNNLSEISALGHRFCFKNLQMIKNEKNLRQKMERANEQDYQGN